MSFIKEENLLHNFEFRLSPEREVIQRGDALCNSTEPVIMEYTVQTE